MKKILIFFSPFVILVIGVFFLIYFDKNFISEQTDNNPVKVSILDLPSLLAVREVSETDMIFSTVEWFEGETATKEAQKDGLSSAPNGFYFRVSDIKKWVLFDDPQSLNISLITKQCTSDKENNNCHEVKTVSFDDYILTRETCLQDQINCQFYIGDEYDLFDILVDASGGIIMVEKYTP